MSPRRIRWTMRAFVYVPLALLAVVVLGMRQPDAPERLKPITGKTAQDHPFELSLARDGEVDGLRATITYDCSDGSRQTTRWHLGGSLRTTFARDGDRVTARYRRTRTDGGVVEKVRFDLEGWVVRDSAAGSLSSVSTWTQRGQTSTCRTHDVEWRASR